jgi:hypothetical protein
MTTLREAAQQALEALEFMADEWGFTQKANRPERWQAITALRAALEQPEQEPVAWMVYTQDGKSVCVTDNPADFIEWRSFPLYTHPPRRTWRGLTEEEIDSVMPYCHNEFDLAEFKDFARAIEAALKERNHD